MNYAISNIGTRECNEDAYKVLEMSGKSVYLVADGLGGYNAGEVASRMAVDAIASYFEANDITTENIASSYKYANRQILENQATYTGMKTTIVGVFYDGSNVYAANVGDSRVYHIRDGKVIGRTKDHSVPQLLFEFGEISEDEMRTHKDRNKIVQALGLSEEFKVNIQQFEYLPGDIFLLSSDGFWENFSYSELMELYDNDWSRWIFNCQMKIEKNADPKQDNYTAVVCGGF